MFVAKSAAQALAAFGSATIIVDASMLAQTRCTDSITAAIADIPHPFHWILFATAVAGDYNVCHIFVVLFIVPISKEVLKLLQSGHKSWFSLVPLIRHPRIVVPLYSFLSVQSFSIAAIWAAHQGTYYRPQHSCTILGNVQSSGCCLSHYRKNR